MNDLFSSFAQIFETIQAKAGQPVYLVGGAVRDAMLNRPIKDLDFVLKENARGTAKKVANALGGNFYMLDETRDTARVICQAESGRKLMLDFATYRSGSLEADLRERDFCMNAMAVDLSVPGSLIDPTGGAADVFRKQIRPCSPNSLRSDPVRALRAVRQSLELGFRILPETAAAIRDAAGLLPGISAERKRDELFRMLDGRQVDTAVRLLDRFGALSAVLPELETLKGVTQSAPHIDAVWEHTLNVVQQLETLMGVLASEYDPDKAANLALSSVVVWLGKYRKAYRLHFETILSQGRSLRALLFLAALYHDIGKPLVRREETGGRIRFFEHEHSGAEMVENRARALVLSVAETQRLTTLVRHHMRIHHLADTHHAPTRRAVYRYFRATGEAGVEIALLSIADLFATYGVTLPQERLEEELAVCRALLDAWWETPQEQVNPQRLLTGRDLQDLFGLTPGPKIGELLELLQEAQATGEIAGREEALMFIEQQLNGVK